MRNNQDLRVKHTRQSLRKALLSLISEKGFDAITISDLTNRADINRSTFYLHYQDKIELLEQITSEMLKQVKETVKVVTIPGKKMPKDMIRQNLVSLLEHIQVNSTFYQIMLGDNMANNFSNRLQTVIQETYLSGLALLNLNNDQSQIKRDIYISFISAAHMGVITNWLKNGLSYSPRFLADQMTQITINGSQILEDI